MRIVDYHTPELFLWTLLTLLLFSSCQTQSLLHQMTLTRIQELEITTLSHLTFEV